jgi:hypothetical protein
MKFVSFFSRGKPAFLVTPNHDPGCRPTIEMSAIAERHVGALVGWIMVGVIRVVSSVIATVALANAVCGAGMPELAASHTMLHLNGYTHHFHAPGANDNLFGLGFTQYDRRAGRVTMAWEADIFLDSGNQLSGYAGRSWTMPLRFGKIGVTAAIMYHRNFLKQNNAGILPVGLPYWETPGSGARLRFYYIPAMRNASDHQIAIQLLTPLRRLATVSSRPSDRGTVSW